MKPDEFENQLQSRPFRPAPKQWRAEILGAARASEQGASSRLPLDGLPWWRAWLWPCPQAWAGLASVWMIILALNMTGSSPSSDMAKRATMIPSEASLSTQRRELARLLDNSNEPAPTPKVTPTGPRSEGASPSKA